MSDKEMAPAVLVTPRSPDHKGVLVIEVSVEQEVVSCFRCEGEDCPKCNGTGFRPVRRCASCGERSGKPSEGGKALLGLRNSRSVAGPFYCMDCHPEITGAGAAALETLERPL